MVVIIYDVDDSQKIMNCIVNIKIGTSITTTGEGDYTCNHFMIASNDYTPSGSAHGSIQKSEWFGECFGVVANT